MTKLLYGILLSGLVVSLVGVTLLEIYDLESIGSILTVVGSILMVSSATSIGRKKNSGDENE